MAKITITDLSTLTGAVNDLNNKFTQIEDELNDKVLYRTNPVGEDNTMNNDLDMDSNDILNAATIRATLIEADSFYVDGVDVNDILAAAGGSIIGANYVTNVATGDGSTTAFVVSKAAGSKGNIQIYIDGVYQNKASFSISGTTVTFTEAPPLNSSVEFIIGHSIGSTSGNASGIDFEQSGTGSVTRTVESKLQDVVSAADFGMSTSATAATNAAAIMNAIASLTGSNGGLVLLPRGIFNVASDTISLVNRQGIELRGSANANGYEEPASGTELVFTSGTVGIDINDAVGSGSASAYNTIKNIKIEGQNSLTYGMRFRGRTNIKNCHVQGCTYGMELVNYGNQTIIDECTCFANDVGCFINGNSTSKVTILNSNFRQNTQGLYFAGGWGVTVSGCVIESNLDEGVVLYKTSSNPVYSMRHFLFENNHFENNATTAGKYSILLDSDTSTGPSRIIFDNNYFAAADLIDIDKGNRIYFRNNAYPSTCYSTVSADPTDVFFYDIDPSSLGITFTSGNRCGYEYFPFSGSGRPISNLSPAGSVVNVVNAVTGTFANTTSSSFVDTGLTASITPQHSQNKILITVNLNGCAGTSGGIAFFNISDGSGSEIIKIGQASNEPVNENLSLQYLHSPSSTSSVTYKVRYCTNGTGAAYLNNFSVTAGDSVSSITLTEIAQ